jgi:hypothetical protein
MGNTKLFGYLKRKYNRWVWKNLPPCKEIVPLLSESQDRKLTLREKTVTKMHLAACTWCVSYLKQIRFLSQAFEECEHRIGTKESGPALSQDARERMKNTLKALTLLFSMMTLLLNL